MTRFFSISSIVDAPCHHGLIQEYCKNLVHYHLSPITLQLVHCMQYLHTYIYLFIYLFI